MIALQSLKYFIWDYCLTKLFEGFERNFNINAKVLVNSNGTIDPKNLKIGMHISEIRGWIKCRYEGGYHKNHYTWLNCKITDVLLYNPQDINNHVHITWRYTTYLENNEIIHSSNPPSYDAWLYNPLENGGSYDKYIEFYP